jgi:DNA-binding transcriptional MocR family regulator
VDLKKRSTSWKIGLLMEIHGFVRHLGAWSAGKGSLHQKLGGAIMQAVRNGLVPPGSKLPSERTLAATLKTSRTTVLAAYDALRESGWLESRPGSGTWISERSRDIFEARNAAHAAASAASPLYGLLAHRDDEGMVDLALGSPLPLLELPVELFTVPPDEYAALVRDRLYYPMGLPALRAAIATYYAKAGLATGPEQILVTNGAQHAITVCAALFLQRGDTALVEDPAYFGAIDAFQAVSARVSSLPVETDGVSPAVLRDRITAAAARLAYLTPTYQNPTGALTPPRARREIARLSAELGVPIIEDGTLADLILEGSPTLPIAGYAPTNAPVITIGSMSKLLWPGLRIGWVRASAPLIERLARVKSTFDLGCPLVTQAIAVRLLAKVEEARRLRRQQLKPRRDLLAALLREQLPHWSFRIPGGGLFFWVSLPNGDSREFAQVALRHRAVVLPGPVMSAAGQQLEYLRLPFIAEPETLRIAVRRLAAAWRDYQSTGRQTPREPVAMV